MYTSLNGIWNVEMLGPDGWEATATAFLEDGKYWAGSENHYTVGNYEVSGNRIEISSAGVQHGKARTVFGKKKKKINSPRQAVSAGLALVPEDRKNHGVNLSMSVKENIIFISIKKWFLFSFHPTFIPPRMRRKKINHYMRFFNSFNQCIYC